MKREPRPCSAEESVARALQLAASEASSASPHPYILSAGRYNPRRPDTPWSPGVSEDAITRHGTTLGCDCSAFVKWANKLQSGRPGYNAGPWATVTGSINVDSLIEDARHEQDLVTIVKDAPRPGDLAAWPSIRGRDIGKSGAQAARRFRVGHIGEIVEVRALEWDWEMPQWSLLELVQCGSKHSPAVHLSTAASWANREKYNGRIDERWASVVLRFVR